jgi:Raf kinase inhibitor-like YbhB/YbcL family protein
MKRFALIALVGFLFGGSFAGDALAQNAPSPQRPKDGWPTIYSQIAAQSSEPMSVTSPAFQANSAVAGTYTQFGKNISPPLAWSKGPVGTQTYVLILEDPDGGAGPNPVFHWAVYDIPAAARGLPEAVPVDAKLANPKGAMQGLNSRNEVGYRGPRPPAGETHNYTFQIYALDAPLGLDPAAANRKAIMDAMNGHVIAKGKMVAPTTGK